tara:strand:+ start:1290 stop:2282 length:993 start_codon:yes stop_codon:yes gene_type:complete
VAKDEKIIDPIDASFDEVSSKMVTTKTKPLAPKTYNAAFGSADNMLKIGDISVECYVLEDGTRVLSGRGMQESIGLGGTAVTHGSKLRSFLDSKDIKPFVSDDLAMALNNPVRFVRPGRGGKPAIAFEATMLIDLCDVVIKANNADKLAERFQPLAVQAQIITSAFAKTGLIAAIDEVTGYQYEREKDALAKIFEQFLSDEKAKWVKTFPLEFYKEIYRLRGWDFKPWTTKRPSVIANWTNDFVYDRLAPSLTEELKKKNPKSSASGRRKDKHHQWFNPENGHPRLREHISGVVALMRASSTWDGFTASLDRAYPRFGDTIQMQLDDIEN